MTALTAADLGFADAGPDRWAKTVRGREVLFRQLVTLADLTPLEQMQRDIMGASELDLMPASALIVVPETGGAVLAAEADGELAGALWGFGGYVDGRPRIVSDWMGVHPQHRSLGLGAELKRLQAALALEAGFHEVVWTVDPLRAANARLNVAKLGATSRRYERDRYGAYAPGLYGGMPTDRLHMEWDLRDPAAHALLRGGPPPAPLAALDAALPTVGEGGLDADRLAVPIPADVDALVASDPDAALAWRLRVRAELQAALAAGFLLDGHRPAGPHSSEPTHVLTRTETSVR